MMKNIAEELAPLYPLLIPLQIYEIKEGQPQNLMTLQMRRLIWMNIQIHVVEKTSRRHWQPNYRKDIEYKLKVDIPNFSGDLNIERFFGLVD